MCRDRRRIRIDETASVTERSDAVTQVSTESVLFRWNQGTCGLFDRGAVLQFALYTYVAWFLGRAEFYFVLLASSVFFLHVECCLNLW